MPLIPTPGQRYLLQNSTDGLLNQLISGGVDGAQATVGAGPGQGNDWRWYFEIIQPPANPEIPEFTCAIKDAWDRYLSSTNKEGAAANEVVTYDYSNTTRKQWRCVWLPKYNKYQITNLSRSQVGVGTRFLGSNASNNKVYLGGELRSDQYLWEILVWPWNYPGKNP